MKARAKKKLGLLDLPGEIRNEVYAYVFEDEIWIDLTPGANHILKCTSVLRPMTAPKPKGSLVPKRTAKPQKIKCGKALGKNSHAHRSKTNWRTSYSGLILTCSLIHREAKVFFFNAPFFIFSSPNRLLKFLTVLPPENLAFVRKVHIAHATYGDPNMPANQVWKGRHDNKWAAVMKLAAEKLTGLETLRIRLVINDRPLTFDLSAHWVQALLPFAPACSTDLAHPRGLSSSGKPMAPLQVLITFHSPWINKKVQLAPALTPAYLLLHELFAEAVRRKLLGWSDADAMAEYNEAKFDKFRALGLCYSMP